VGDYSDGDLSSSGSPERKRKASTPPPKEQSIAPALKEALVSSRKKEEKLAPPVHPDLVPVWEEIVTGGLEVAERDALIEGLPRIENCPFLKPSKLNTELAKTIGPVLTRRENQVSRKQTQLAAWLLGVAKLLSVFISANVEADKEYVNTLGAVSC